MLVVLDLNGTILDSTHHPRAGVTPNARARKKVVYFRPHMHLLLKTLLNHPEISVGVWTSNIRANAEAIIDTILTPHEKAQLAFIYSREQCQVYPDYSSKKPLLNLSSEGFDLATTVIIDDSPEKILAPQLIIQQCYLYVPTFRASPDSLHYDNALPKLLTTILERLNTSK